MTPGHAKLEVDRLGQLPRQAPGRLPPHLSRESVQPAGPTDVALDAAAPSATVLKRILNHRMRLRRGRDRTCLDWPGFDMLLDLAAVKRAGEVISISAVCVSSGAAQSTALRKMAALEAAGLVRRFAHGPDKRRVCVTLTDSGVELVDRLVAEQIQFFASIAPDRAA